MSELADTEHVEQVRQHLTELLRQEERGPVSVIGPPGSGRRLLTRSLAQDGLAEVEPPPLEDPDAPLHALLQAASQADHEALELSLQDALPLRERARRVAERLARSRPGMVLRLPDSWRLADPQGEVETPDHRLRLERAREVVLGLCDSRELRSILIASSRWQLPAELLRQEPLRLERMALRAQPDFTGFGSYAAAAHELHTWCAERKARPSPLQFRLAVALRVLGGLDETTLGWLSHPGPGLQVLETRLLHALRRQPRLALHAYRAALARRPLEREALVAVAGLSSEHAPLLTECLGYGGDPIVLHEHVRSVLLRLAQERELREQVRQLSPQVHYELSRIHARADGVSSVLQSPSVADWLERAHHLAGAGNLGAAEWEQLDLRCREFYWDRGRALSLMGEYEASAHIYRKCLEQFGEQDDYAQHYLGFNLDRAGLDRQAAEEGLRTAVRLATSNVWWNTRLVTFLIGQARFLEARREWLAAMDRIDPDGELVQRDAWLALHSHRWVVASWLDHAQVELAREVFDAIPPVLLQQDERLRVLEERLGDAEEARALGESVYPASVPLAERWQEPRLVPRVNARGAALRGWYPGRVLEATAESVLLAFGVPHPEPAQRRVKVRELSAEEWRQAYGSPPQEARGFVEIGSYADDSLLVRAVPDTPASWSHELDIHHELRYLRRWKAR